MLWKLIFFWILGSIPILAMFLCPKPPMVKHATFKLYDNSSGNYIDYSCEAGYRINGGGEQLDCINGSIVGKVPTCAKKVCPPLVLGTNMSADKPGASYGDSVSITCKPGYVVSGSSREVTQEISCVDDPASDKGKWENSIQQCVEIKCIGLPHHSKMLSNKTGQRFSYGEVIEFRCQSGYEYNGAGFLPVRIKCNSTWKYINSVGRSLVCKKMRSYLGCFVLASPMNSTTQSVGGIAACRNHCRKHVHKYSALDGDKCACAETLGGTRVENRLCNKVCPHKRGWSCGGVNQQWSIFISFDGCYWSNNSLLLQGSLLTPPNIDETCLEFCRGQNASYSLLLPDRRCKCLLDEDPVSKYLSSSCHALMVNGNYPDHHFVVRSIELHRTTATSCDELFDKGVRYHGYYYLITNGTFTNTWCHFKDGTPCDLDWVGFAGSCYHLRYGNFTFDSAFHYCIDRDSHIVSVHSEKEMLFLSTTISAYRDWSQIAKWYIGLYDPHKGNAYSWTDGTMLVYDNFSDNEPDSDSEQCVLLDKKIQYKWKDHDCSRRASVVCKKIQNSSCVKVDNYTSLPTNVFFRDHQMTTALCFEKCRGKGISISGVIGESCHCLNAKPNGSSLPWLNCSYPCPSNQYQICGESSSLSPSVFVTKDVGQPRAGSCEELELQGIANGTFTLSKNRVECNYEGSVVCPSSWLSINGNCYKFSTGKTSFSKALKYCHHYNASLLAINDKEEQESVQRALTNLKIYGKIDSWMTGLVDNTASGKLRWSDGQPMQFTNWKSGPPSGYNSKIVFLKTNSGYWKLEKKSRGSFICEKNQKILGCHAEPSQLRPAVANYVDMTITLCVEACRGNGTKYAMLKVDSCFCSNFLTSSLDSIHCSKMCPGHINQYCGGLTAVSVHYVDAYPAFAQNCADLFQEGIHVPGNYLLNNTVHWCHFLDNTSCESGWIGHNGHCYLLVEKVLNGNGAQKYCLDNNAVLTSVVNKEEHEFLKTAIKGRFMMSTGSAVYVGAADDLASSLFSWADGGLFLYFVWKPSNQPSIAEGQQVALIKTQTFAFANKNSADMYAFICKKVTDYTGCFSGIGALAVAVLTGFPSMTVTLCKQLCLGRSYNFSLTGPDSCSCLGSLDASLSREANDTLCRTPCSLNHLQSCGAASGQVVVHKLDIKDTASSCSELISNGIFYQTTYRLSVKNNNNAFYQKEKCGFADNSGCDAGWLGKKGFCFKFDPKKKTFSQSRDSCFGMRALLAGPASQMTESFIRDILTSTPYFSKSELWHVGLRDLFMSSGHFTTSGGKMVKLANATRGSAREMNLLIKKRGWAFTGSDDARYYICERNSGFLGCFNVSMTAVTSLMGKDYLSATLCVEFCRGQDLRFAVTSKRDCHCYKAADKTAITRDGKTCEDACNAHPHQPCGSSVSSSVFDVDWYTKMAASCDELFLSGVIEPVYYYLHPRNDTIIKVRCFSPAPFGKEIVLSAEAYSSFQQTGLNSDTFRITILPSTGAWAPSNPYDGIWIQLHLPSLFLITGIKTQGRVTTSAGAQWVNVIRLLYGDDGNLWTTYKELTNGSITEELGANKDGRTVETKLFSDPFLAQFIRIYPLRWMNAVALRFGILGDRYDLFRANLTYMGCFGDFEPSQFHPVPQTGDEDSCRSHCRRRSYPVYGLTTGSPLVCKCGNSYGRHGLFRDELCSKDCRQTSKYCGSNATLIALYRTFKKHCSRALDIGNTTARVLFLNNSEEFLYKTEINYTCLPGHEYVDGSLSKVALCLQNNSWTSLPSSCQAKRCPTLPSIEHGQSDTNRTDYGTDVTFHCHPGHMFPDRTDAVVVSCQADAQWSALPRNCTKKTCPAPYPVVNARVTSLNGSTVQYTCEAGQFFSDASNVKISHCQSDFTWSDIQDGCVSDAVFKMDFVVLLSHQDTRISNPVLKQRARSVLDCASACVKNIACSALSFVEAADDINCDIFTGRIAAIELSPSQGWHVHYISGRISTVK